MDLIMYTGEVTSQLSSMNENLSISVNKAQLLLTEVRDFLFSSSLRLKSESYDQQRKYYNDYHIPLLEGFIINAGRLQTANNRYKACIEGYLDSGYVNERAMRQDLDFYTRVT